MGQLINTFERKEKKYVLSSLQLTQLMLIIGDKLEDDQFARSTISSLYYDTDQFEMINRSLEKPLYKEKVRVRAYGALAYDTPVFVELKKKFKGIVYKRRIQMSDVGARSYLAGMPYEQAAALGGPAFESLQQKNPRQNIRELDACLRRHESLRPGIMVVVERHSMRTNDGSNVRITFDMNARWRATGLSFGAGFGGTPIFNDDSIIMEVKALGSYPLWLVHARDAIGAYPVSCSKVGKAYQALAAGSSKTAPQPSQFKYQPNASRMKGAHCA